MKKVLAFIRSMKFGILLMLFIALLSVVGTIIPQGKEFSWYVQTYQNYHGWILMLKLYDIYNSWYFQLLLILLMVNLTLCSLIRIRSVVKAKAKEKEMLMRCPHNISFNAEQHDKLAAELRAMHCAEETEGDSIIFRKNSFGRYGSFITHLSILLILIFGALALYLPKNSMQYCLPGESVQLEDGTDISVQSFRMEDENGRPDYTSEISVRLPDGRESGTREISVNYPLSFGRLKIYQQSFGTAGVVTAYNLDSGENDVFPLTKMVFLSMDGVNGIWYEAVYPDHITTSNGSVMPISSRSGKYTNPVYQVEIAQDGAVETRFILPGEEIELGNLKFVFETPLDYPGLRVKNTPPAINALLCVSFLIMIAGLYITFFCQPVLVRLDQDGGAVGGSKPEGTLLLIQQGLQDYQTGKVNP